MCVCMYACMHVDGWMDVDGWMWMDGWMDGCGWMDVDGWMDGCTYTHVRCTSKHVMIYLHVYFLINPNLIEDD